MAITIGTDGFISAANVVARYLPQINGYLDATGQTLTTTLVEAHIRNDFYVLTGWLQNVGLTPAAAAADTTALGLCAHINGLGAAIKVANALAASMAAGANVDAMNTERDALMRDVKDGTIKIGTLDEDRETTPGISESLRDGGDDEDPPFKMSDRL